MKDDLIDDLSEINQPVKLLSDKAKVFIGILDILYAIAALICSKIAYNNFIDVYPDTAITLNSVVLAMLAIAFVVSPAISILASFIMTSIVKYKDSTKKERTITFFLGIYGLINLFVLFITISLMDTYSGYYNY